MTRRVGAFGLFVSLLLAMLVSTSMTPVRAAPPVATPSPGYDARLQESRKPDSSAPVTTGPESKKPVVKKHKRVVRRRWHGAQVYDEAAPGPPYPPYPYYEARPEYYRPYPYYGPIIPLYGFGLEFGW